MIRKSSSILKLYCCVIINMMLCGCARAQNQTILKTIDSIHSLRTLSKNENLELKKRLEFAKKAYKFSKKIKNDTLTISSLNNLSYIYILNNNLNKPLIFGHKALKLAHSIKDTIGVADISALIGILYSLKQTHSDSSYYYFMTSANLYKKKKANDNYFSCKLNAADVLTSVDNYFNSNKILTSVASEIKELNPTYINNDHLLRCYISLGVNSYELHIYEKAKTYLEKSLAINANLLESKTNFSRVNIKLSNYDANHIYISINLAETLNVQKKYKKAATIYKELLKKYNRKELIEKDPLSYAAIKNNMAYRLFKLKKSHNDTIITLFKEANNIFNTLNDHYGITVCDNDFSEFLLAIDQKDTSRALALRAYKTAKNIKNFKEASRAMLTLSKTEDGEKGKAYLYEHIKLNDSLLKSERLIRNKFARIEFETDSYIADNKQLTKRNTLISISALVSIFILSLLFIIRHQRSKNKTLQLEQAQQEANEDIYKLMLNEQHNVQEGRLRERYHIAEELHDGVLNTLAGTRLGIEYLSSLDHVEASQYQLYIKELHKAELDIRDLSHALKYSKLDKDKGFVAILEEYVSQCNALQRFTCTTALDKNIPWQEISDMVKVNLFRCIQEALQNTAKHAQAQTVHITLALKDSTNVELTITDDGNGFDANETAKGIGLDNMKARANRLKGSFKIDATPHKGTTLHFVIPI